LKKVTYFKSFFDRIGIKTLKIPAGASTFFTAKTNGKIKDVNVATYFSNRVTGNRENTFTFVD
jgi:hypothetical protein